MGLIHPRHWFESSLRNFDTELFPPINEAYHEEFVFMLSTPI